MGKKPKKRVTTPVGVANFTYLDKPDTEGQYADDKYKLTISWDDGVNLDKIDEAAVQIAEEYWNGDFDEAELKLPYRTAEEQSREQFEGKVTMLAKTKYKPELVDTVKQPLPEGVRPMGGDIVRAVVDLLPYESTEKVKVGKKTETITVKGVSPQLKLVQLIEKRAGGSAVGALDDDVEGYVGTPQTDSGLDDDDDEV